MSYPIDIPNYDSLTLNYQRSHLRLVFAPELPRSAPCVLLFSEVLPLFIYSLDDVLCLKLPDFEIIPRHL